MPGLLREGRVTANGLRLAYLEGGSGPLVVLLHGWPDTPHTRDHQMAGLAGAGFQVAAPWLHGYPPTEIPRSGYFDIGTLALDARELIRVLGGSDPCLLVGQDWGASIGYQVLAAFPEAVRSAVVMTVPHPAATRESLLRAEHVHRSFHWFFFQLPQLPERALSADNHAFVDWLWDYWTAPGFTDEEHLAKVKRMLAVPGALEATPGYYRAIFDPARADPDLAEVRQAEDGPIMVPTLALCGAEDKRAEVMQARPGILPARTGSSSCPTAHTAARAAAGRSRSLSWTGSPRSSRQCHAEMMVIGLQRQNWHICAPTRPTAVRTTGTKIRSGRLRIGSGAWPVTSGGTADNERTCRPAHNHALAQRPLSGHERAPTSPPRHEGNAGLLSSMSLDLVARDPFSVRIGWSGRYRVTDAEIGRPIIGARYPRGYSPRWTTTCGNCFTSGHDLISVPGDLQHPVADVAGFWWHGGDAHADGALVRASLPERDRCLEAGPEQVLGP